MSREREAELRRQDSELFRRLEMLEQWHPGLNQKLKDGLDLVRTENSKSKRRLETLEQLLTRKPNGEAR